MIVAIYDSVPSGDAAGYHHGFFPLPLGTRPRIGSDSPNHAFSGIVKFTMTISSTWATTHSPRVGSVSSGDGTRSVWDGLIFS